MFGKEKLKNFEFVGKQNLEFDLWFEKKLVKKFKNQMIFIRVCAKVSKDMIIKKKKAKI